MLPQKVLIIDDEHMIRLTTSILLKQKGIAVVSASSGQEGLDMAISEKPELILLDIMMPVMDGWEVFDKLRSSEATAAIPVIIFTAGDFIEAERIAGEKQVSGIIRKPFHVDDLLKMFDISSLEN
ncbi:MAG: response regulator [Chitinivibrionales bacterium]|nr:response regulator [Chitinivibrionales bacterium]